MSLSLDTLYACTIRCHLPGKAAQFDDDDDDDEDDDSLIMHCSCCVGFASSSCF